MDVKLYIESNINVLTTKKGENVKMSKFKKMCGIVFACVFFLVGLICIPQLVDTVEKGTYQIKQAAISGNMTAKMTPGIWYQGFGDIDPWPKAETFFFTKDILEGKKVDESIEVRFNGGSVCDISGTLRIVMPVTEKDVINLVTEDGYKSYPELEHKLILPTVRNALRLTANLMSARESYSERRTDFIFWASDQIENGLYQTEDHTTKVKDVISGEYVTKTIKLIKMEKDGVTPKYQRNPLANTGITLANFEIKVFSYENKVKKQIAKQQEAIMAVSTAKANAQRAEQDKLTIQAQGKANVAKARYVEEQIKIKAVVEAQKLKEVAILRGQQKRDVAELAKDEAEFTKAEQILLGEGEAKRKRLVIEADGALTYKGQIYKEVMSDWANAYRERKVPTVVFGGGSNGLDKNALEMADVMSLMAMKQLGLDLTLPNKTK